eukprot:3136742-Pyramimonas_sp.AAC.1
MSITLRPTTGTFMRENAAPHPSTPTQGRQIRSGRWKQLAKSWPCLKSTCGVRAISSLHRFPQDSRAV